VKLMAELPGSEATSSLQQRGLELGRSSKTLLVSLTPQNPIPS